MSEILRYAEKYNIPLIRTQKEKIESIEVMLSLSEVIILIVGNALSIRSKNYIYVIFESLSTLTLKVYDNHYQDVRIVDGDFMTLLNHIVNSIDREEMTL